MQNFVWLGVWLDSNCQETWRTTQGKNQAAQLMSVPKPDFGGPILAFAALKLAFLSYW